jgi:hypothetical protein
MPAVNIPLSQPVKAHGQDISAIALCPPLGRDFSRFGFPFFLRLTDGTATEELNPRAVTALASELAGIPTSSVDALDGMDWLRVAEAIREFVGAVPPEGAVLPFKLRRLKGRELRLHGLPFLLRRSPGVLIEEFNAPVIAAIMADLGGVPVETVDALKPSAWLEGVSVIHGFLAETTAPGLSTPPGALPDSSGVVPATSSI